VRPTRRITASTGQPAPGQPERLDHVVVQRPKRAPGQFGVRPVIAMMGISDRARTDADSARPDRQFQARSTRSARSRPASTSARCRWSPRTRAGDSSPGDPLCRALVAFHQRQAHSDSQLNGRAAAERAQPETPRHVPGTHPGQHLTGEYDHCTARDSGTSGSAHAGNGSVSGQRSDGVAELSQCTADGAQVAVRGAEGVVQLVPS